MFKFTGLKGYFAKAPNDTPPHDITATQIGADKVGLDLVVLKSEPLPVVFEFIKGTMPEISWNKAVERTVNASTLEVDFSYNENLQFTVRVDNLYSDRTFTVIGFNHLILEDSGALFLENGSQLLLEG